MTRFSLRLFARSRRWLAPVAVLVSWILLQQWGGSPLRAVAPSALALVFITALAGVLLLNTDGDAHREVLAAAVGGHGRLHRHRILAALGLNLAFGLLLALWIMGTAKHPSVVAAAEVLATLVGAAALGTGWASLLGRPVTANPVVTLLGLVVIVPLLVLLPPVTWCLNRLSAGQGAVAFVLAAAGTVLLAAGTTLSTLLADRRATVRQL